MSKYHSCATNYPRGFWALMAQLLLQSSEGPRFRGPLVARGHGRMGAPDRLGALVA